MVESPFPPPTEPSEDMSHPGPRKLEDLIPPSMQADTQPIPIVSRASMDNDVHTVPLTPDAAQLKLAQAALEIQDGVSSESAFFRLVNRAKQLFRKPRS